MADSLHRELAFYPLLLQHYGDQWIKPCYSKSELTDSFPILQGNLLSQLAQEYTLDLYLKPCCSMLLHLYDFPNYQEHSLYRLMQEHVLDLKIKPYHSRQ